MRRHLRPNTTYGEDSLAVSEGTARFSDFIKRIICKCDADKFDYVVNWLAFLLQKPNELPEVALVLMGGQGTGKGTFTRPLLQIAGQHGIELSTVDQLTGLTLTLRIRCSCMLMNHLGW